MMQEEREIPPLALYGNPEITPDDFERLVASAFREASLMVTSRQVEHDVKVSAHDGTYQIDVQVTERRCGLDYITLVECKRHYHPIKRDVVALLADKVRSLGAHKGVVFSTSPFQTGAIDYANAHGIALIKVTDTGFLFETRSLNMSIDRNSFPRKFCLQEIRKNGSNYSMKLRDHNSFSSI